ncbi:MAG: CHAP domain-containing protein [Clostridia bacterium]|nr:CHAP domain-containing protein [Clostridia bacterium]
MKRFTSVILALILALGVFMSFTATEASASTAGHTQAEAVAWTNAKVGTSIDYDGVYGVQCVDLVNMYYAYLGQRLGSIGYAYNLSASVPSGWQVLGNNCDPRPGDIFVWNAYEYGAAYTGHTGIITEVRSNSYVFVDYNGGGRNEGGTPHEKSGVRSFSYLVRPDFAAPVVNYSFDVNVVLDGSANNSGISGLTFDVYINGSKAANDVKDFCTTYRSGTTYKVDDIKVSGNLIYKGNSSYSGTLNSNTEVRLPVNTGLTVKSETSGKYKVTVPANYSFDIYSSATATSRSCYALPKSESYYFYCQKKYVLSDGTVRYRYTTNDGSYNYFNYTSKLTVVDVNALTLSVRSKETDNFKVTIPANYKLILYTDVTSPEDTHYIKASDSAYNINCSVKYVMSDGSVRYGYQSNNVYYYFTYVSGMKVEEGCSKGHTYTTDSTKLAKAATCTSAAQYYYKRCSKCGSYSSETFTKGSALGHKYSKISTVKPTCTESGYSMYKCANCSSSYVADLTQATGHTDRNSDGKCDSCSYVIWEKPAENTEKEDTGSTDHTDDETDSYCDCPCHSGGSMGKIWQVLMAICRALGLTEYRYCDCGSRHF